MKVIIILDQIQAGLGGKERADTPFGGKKIAMGSADNVERALADVDGKIIGTFYCGTSYFLEHKDVVQEKFAKMAQKMAADVVIVGPTFDYTEFAEMAGSLGSYISKATTIPVIGQMAQEKNEAIISQYQDQFLIVKMPKKGAAGLTEALQNLAQGCKLLASGADTAEFKQQSCY
ncbi:glycine/sarcosine/betaine reductase selenoprotein B family protein [Lactobacillus sp. ESL0731]|uniref:GrdB-related putative oxidoreductase n=1 Tax=unclassified Lactobacillus TaxID=2620435 RepID=UPI0023F8DFF4|nr:MULTISPECIES: GrdB-related putative oxidoreductase [unclassified Lactobacillus]WEV51747.1 glycine/sarcosine/betaine reductase selenoprotein B family protein [Lactobacillus sp. ESL0700]WEV62876.1 glycine/sarcosine/betaine reductase selenoprotein B family protein [Lactobacillus sp. ESL0731]